MRLIIPHDTSRDCEQRWAGCFAFLKDVAGEEQLIRISHVLEISARNGTATIQYSVYDASIGMWEERVSARVTNDSISLPPIKLGYVDVGNMALYISRKGGRTYRLGVTSSKYHVHSPFKQVAATLGYTRRPEFDGLVPLLYNRTYRQLERSISLIMDKSLLSSSISPSLAIGVSTKTAFLGLYRGTQLIGELNTSTAEVVLPHAHKYFMEEVQEQGLEVVLTSDVIRGKTKKERLSAVYRPTRRPRVPRPEGFMAPPMPVGGF